MREPVEFALEFIRQFRRDAVAGLLDFQAHDGERRAEFVRDFRGVIVHLRERGVEPREQIVQLLQQVAKLVVRLRQRDGFAEVLRVFGLQLPVHARDGPQ